MATKINKHVFHGIYSNFGYRPEFSIDRRISDVPIHFFRASFAEKDPDSSVEKPKEFETEEEVFKWYKKNKYGSTLFDKLEFPNKFCKNYLIIPETEFYKYKGLFHKMIKGVIINSDIEIESKGNNFSPECPECKRDFKDGGAEAGDTAGPIVFNSPDGSPTYFKAVGVADDIGYLNGTKITDGNAASAFNQNLIPKTPLSTLSFTAVDTLGANVRIEATVVWYKPIEYNQKIKHNINFNSTKIFDFQELQKRLGADSVNYETIINIKEDKNKEELLYNSNTKIFKDEWAFDSNAFKSIFQNSNKFNFNSTFINDPVIISQNPFSDIFGNIDNVLSVINKHTYDLGGVSPLTPDIVDKQKNFEKEFTKFGSAKYNINNNNSIVDSTYQYLDFYISDLFYIRSKKIYMCFFELYHEIYLYGSIIDKDKNCEDTECEDISSSSSSSSSSSAQTSSYTVGQNAELMLNILKLLEEDDIVSMLNTESPASILATTNDNYDRIGSTNPMSINYILTTSDTIQIDPPKYKTSDCAEEEKELEFEKTKCQIKLSNNSFDIEVFRLKEQEFIFDNKDCKELSFEKEINNTFKISYLKQPSFELLEWQRDDFDKNNIFPPKIT
jgi:hypothetical protein